MVNLEAAISYLQTHTATMNTVTRDFGRMPTPRASLAVSSSNVMLSEVEAEDEYDLDDYDS